jgi:hypothetical protein
MIVQMQTKYYSVDVYFNSAKDVSDLLLPIKIYSRLVEAVRPHTIASNFNKYWGPTQKPKIDFRIMTSNLTEVRSTVRLRSLEFQTDLLISGHGNEFNEWIEPEFVQRAHEIGSQLAVVLANGLESDRHLSSKFAQQDKQSGFLMHYILDSMNKAGFRLTTIWSAKRDLSPVTDAEIGSLTDNGAHVLAEGIKAKPSPSFIERFLHAFMNCTIQEHERSVFNYILTAVLFNHIGESWRGDEPVLN